MIGGTGSAMPHARFRSAVHPMIRLLPLYPLSICIWSVLGPAPNWFVALVMFAAFAFLMSLIARTEYVFDDKQLMVRSGPFRWRVPTDSISHVRPTRSWLAGPALSFDRLELIGAHGSLLVSPRDRRAFLEQLKSAAPHVDMQGHSTHHDQH